MELGLWLNAYTYGFNGMERDDEVKGSGNSYDFGARIYDSRLGRWFSVDPLANKLPNWSPYTGMGDNPIYYVDEDGKYFTGSTDLVKAVYARVLSLLANPNTSGADLKKLAQFKAALEKMDASDVEFNVNVSNQLHQSGGTGETEFDFVNNRVLLTVESFADESKVPGTKEGRTAHELVHGAQFLNGELDFADDNNDGLGQGLSPNTGGSHDRTDEHDAVDIQSIIDEDIEPSFNDKAKEKKIKNQKSVYDDLVPVKTNTTETPPMKTKGFKFKSIKNFKSTPKQTNEKKPILSTPK